MPMVRRMFIMRLMIVLLSRINRDGNRRPVLSGNRAYTAINLRHCIEHQCKERNISDQNPVSQFDEHPQIRLVWTKLYVPCIIVKSPGRLHNCVTRTQFSQQKGRSP